MTDRARPCRVYFGEPCISACLIACRRICEEQRQEEARINDLEGAIRDGMRRYWRERDKEHGR